jgi:hypothetical protein
MEWGSWVKLFQDNGDPAEMVSELGEKNGGSG